jgi:hypothetical protein
VIDVTTIITHSSTPMREPALNWKARRLNAADAGLMERLEVSLDCCRFMRDPLASSPALDLLAYQYQRNRAAVY